MRIYTIGHSNHTFGEFLRLLRRQNVDMLIDVRSIPFSKGAPQFNRYPFSESLRQASVPYLYVGERLGGRPKDPELLADGVPDYEKISASIPFRKGIEDILGGLPRWPGRAAMMCSEEDPAMCHRRRLVGAALEKHSVEVLHIRGDGDVETEDQIRARLHEDGPNILDMFGSD